MKWLTSDIAFLKNNYPFMGTAEISKCLGRTENSIRTKTCRSGMLKQRLSAEQRFEQYVQKSYLPNQCWVWVGVQDYNGYGRFFYNRKNDRAHRVSYQLYVGPIPDGMTIDHLCRNRRCVNPTHLEVVSLRENILRGLGIPAINARKTHCKNGHEFNKINTYYYRNGGRACRICSAELQRNRHLSYVR